MRSIEIEEMFKDAERLYEEALKDLKAGRIRKAAENAWCTTLRVTDALIQLEPARSLSGVIL